MTCRNTRETYGCGTRFLHALIAVLIILQFGIGISMGYIDNKSWSGIFYTVHKSLGICLFFVGLAFVLWAMTSPKPVWPEKMKVWERFAAKTVHWLLYVFVILMPLSGWIMSTASGHSPNFFWIVKIPFPFISLNKPLAEVAAELHYIFAWFLGVLIVIHILAALKHQFIDKDNLMRRIWCRS
jgi:cytochrome b561